MRYFDYKNYITNILYLRKSLVSFIYGTSPRYDQYKTKRVWKEYNLGRQHSYQAGRRPQGSPMGPALRPMTNLILGLICDPRLPPQMVYYIYPILFVLAMECWLWEYLSGKQIWWFYPNLPQIIIIAFLGYILWDIDIDQVVAFICDISW